MHFKYKLLIAFLLVALVPIGIIGEYSILSSTKALTNKALEELENNANLEAEKMENYLNTCKNDIIFLSKSPKILKYTETKHPEDRWDLEFSLLSISLDKGYHQVGYMDDNTIIYVKDKKIPKEETIERPDIPELEYGQVYVSEIFLKRNKGVFEIPFKPIILFAAPIYSDEERRGYVYTEAYLTEFFSEFETSKPEVFFTDESGNYLYHPNKLKGWSTVFNTKECLHKDYNTDVSEILSGKSGTCIVGNEIISYVPVEVQNQRWFLIMSNPKDIILESVRTFKIGFYIVVSVVIISAVSISYFLSKIITEPLVSLTC